MVYLLKHVGKFPDDSDYEAAITTIKVGITTQTNQAMVRYKFFKEMA